MTKLQNLDRVTLEAISMRLGELYAGENQLALTANERSMTFHEGAAHVLWLLDVEVSGALGRASKLQ